MATRSYFNHDNNNDDDNDDDNNDNDDDGDDDNNDDYDDDYLWTDTINNGRIYFCARLSPQSGSYFNEM